jgi:hypothetical protein
MRGVSYRSIMERVAAARWEIYDEEDGAIAAADTDVGQDPYRWMAEAIVRLDEHA